MKACRTCGEIKHLSEYYKHAQMADGHLNICKVCVKARVAKHRVDNIESVKEYDRNRPNHKERLNKRCERARQRRKSGDLDFIESERRRTRKYRSQNPEKYKAHGAVSNAIKTGVIVKPCKCERCESTTNIQGHHWSYLEEHWLDVIWLCTSCHSEEHKLLRANGNDIE